MSHTYPTPMEVARKVAVVNPQLAYYLAKVGAQQRLIGFQTLSLTIESGTVDSPLEATFPTTLGEDFYVLDIRSTVQRPTAFAGSIFKGQSDFYNAQQSGLYVRMQVVGGLPGRRYVINDQYAPLEIIAPNASSVGNSLIVGLDAVLQYSQSVRADFTLRRAYAPSELPLEVSISFLGWSLGCQDFSRFDAVEATSFLRGLREFDGIVLPTNAVR